MKTKRKSGRTSRQGRELSMSKKTGVEQGSRVVESEELVMNSRVGESCDRSVRTKKTRSRLHNRNLVSLDRENPRGDRAEHAGDCQVTVATGRRSCRLWRRTSCSNSIQDQVVDVQVSSNPRTSWRRK